MAGFGRPESSGSFMSGIGRSQSEAQVDTNGYTAPGSPSKLSEELARRLAVVDSNPSQPQVSPLMLASSEGGHAFGSVHWQVIILSSCLDSQLQCSTPSNPPSDKHPHRFRPLHSPVVGCCAHVGGAGTFHQQHPVAAAAARIHLLLRAAA